MFGRRYDDTPLVDENILHHHPPYANLNPFSSYDQPMFSSYPQNDYWNNNQYVDDEFRQEEFQQFQYVSIGQLFL